MSQFDGNSDLISAEIYDRFRQAIALRKWPNGTPLTKEQLDICMQAIIRYEYLHLPPEERTGYVAPAEDACSKHAAADDEVPVRILK